MVDCAVRRSVGLRLATISIGLVLAGLVGEATLRVLIFTPVKAFKIFQNPNLYSDYRADDDWWKLYLRFGGKDKPPDPPDPLLGWVFNYFDRQTFVHRQADRVGDRRPVLLFGDSFAHCMGEVTPFEVFLNSDAEFSKRYYLLNYGMPGYGLDQIYLLMQKVVPVYKDPIVIFSFMLEDLDRCVMSFRGGEKPRFEVVGDDLKLTNSPIDARPYEWLARNPITIKSYLYEFLRRAPYKAWGRMIGKPWQEENKVEEKKRVGAALLRAILDDLGRSRVTFTVLLFHPLRGTSWRDEFVQSFFQNRGVPYIGTETIIRKHSGQQDVFSPEMRLKYMQTDLDHPNTLQNQIVAEYMKQFVMSVN
jgi:hypothetical protein